jgi:hypothetical protein
MAAFVGLVPLSLSAAPTQAVPRTQCGGRLGGEFTGYAIPGVPLIAGFSTGMSRQQVKRIAPRLSLYESRQRLELFPGVSLRATAMYRDLDYGGLEWVRLFGTSREAPIEALTARYGEPIQLDSSDSGIYRVRVLKWCDGKRVFVLTERSYDFSLAITSERLHR